MIKKWKTISSEVAFANKWFPIQKDVVKLPNGRIISDYYTWNKFDVAMVVPITKQNRIVLVRQYKHGSKEIMIECPAGYVNENENVENSAKRELLEETGYNAPKLEILGKFIHDPTKTTGISKSYLARDVKKVSDQSLDKNEEIEILEVKFEKVLDMINKGEIWATGTIASIFLALNRLKYKP